MSIPPHYTLHTIYKELAREVLTAYILVKDVIILNTLRKFKGDLWINIPSILIFIVKYLLKKCVV